jgi:hypothetical protein
MKERLTKRSRVNFGKGGLREAPFLMVDTQLGVWRNDFFCPMTRLRGGTPNWLFVIENLIIGVWLGVIISLSSPTLRRGNSPSQIRTIKSNSYLGFSARQIAS